MSQEELFQFYFYNNGVNYHETDPKVIFKYLITRTRYTEYPLWQSNQFIKNIPNNELYNLPKLRHIFLLDKYIYIIDDYNDGSNIKNAVTKEILYLL